MIRWTKADAVEVSAGTQVIKAAFTRDRIHLELVRNWYG